MEGGHEQQNERIQVLVEGKPDALTTVGAIAQDGSSAFCKFFLEGIAIIRLL